ncbi:hypothetical protein [Planobispora takensis]|uniref:Uncharacterized protein n=1 Tax=Planobispora takensis TaxID=1367882 RepID=A0A8J3SPC0_9ACTN|nr:hypothetical protein [Planobispora takensis]GIH98111.1 hypothetical protein Pta02_01200 [Planobispora takensis]
MSVGPQWVRLGDLLKARRIELSRAVETRWRYRKNFVDDHPHLLTQRTTSNLEESRRDSYEDTTLLRAEHAYRWKPGSIQAVLEGGEPIPLPIDTLAEIGVDGEELSIQHTVTDQFDQTSAVVKHALTQMSDEDRARAESKLDEIMRAALREMGVDV